MRLDRVSMLFRSRGRRMRKEVDKIPLDISRYKTSLVSTKYGDGAYGWLFVAIS